MGLLDPAAPLSANSTTVTQQQLPPWYNDFLTGLSARGIDVASRPYTPYDGARVAGTSPLQQLAFTQAQNNAGAYQPMLQQAASRLGSIPSWTDPATQAAYTSPHTSAVVDEIARRGNRNFTENIMPQVNGAFIGAGQFGSTRNADAMGRAARDVQDNITGAQANALESGYRSAADIFGADAGRQIQSAGQLGALGQLQQQLGSADATMLAGLGGLQQQQQQRGLDTAFQDWQTGQNYDMTQLMQLRQLMSGMQLPSGAVSVSNSPTGGYGASPLEWMGSLINQIPTQQQPGTTAPAGGGATFAGGTPGYYGGAPRQGEHGALVAGG